MKNNKFKNKVKAGIAGLLLGATLITGVGCANYDNGEFVDENDTELTFDENKVAQTQQTATNIRKNLTKIINNTFSNYITVEGQSAGETIILEDGTPVTRRIGCVTAPNGDNVAWFGDEYYAIYADGQAFLKDNEYPEETEQYISFKEALLDIVNDEHHNIIKLDEKTYQINDNDCNVYKFVIKNGKIHKIYDTYTDFTTGKNNTSGVHLNETDEQEFNERLNDAIEEIKDAQEYFNGLTK